MLVPFPRPAYNKRDNELEGINLAKYKKDCVVCGTPFEAARADKKTCSDPCKKKLQRGVKTPQAPFIVESEELGPEQRSSFLAAEPEAHTNMEPDSSIVAAEKKSPKAEPSIDTVNAAVTRSEQRARINERLKAKGLPLVLDAPEQMQFVPTGVPALDALTAHLDSAGVGGLPRKHITEIYGPKGSGKSSLVKLIHKANPDLRILFFDAEGGLTAPPENIDIIKGNIVEDIMPALIDLVADGKTYDLVIVDSVASLVTRKQFEEDPEGLAAMARVFGPQVKRLVAHLVPIGSDGYPDKVPGTAVVFINQFRDTTKSFGITEYTVGGRALEYYASLRLVFRSYTKDHIIRDGKLAGQQVNVKVEKTRFGTKQAEFKFPLMFDVLQDYNEYYVKRVKELLG